MMSRLSRQAQCRLHGLEVSREANAAELPAGRGIEEVTVGRSNMTARSGAGASPQDDLVHHELAVVFTQGPGCGPIPGIGRIGGLRPFPDVAKHLQQGWSVGTPAQC